MGDKGLSKITYAKKDIFRAFKFQLFGFKGLHTALSPLEIEDSEFPAIVNYLPSTPINIKKTKSPTALATLSSPIILYYEPVIGLGVMKFLILNDGSMGTLANTVYTQHAPAGTFSTNPVQIGVTEWGNKFILIIDQNYGYFSFDGTTLTNISTTVKGNCITIWNGRVFMALGRLVNYTAPSLDLATAPSDFSQVNGGGYFNITSTMIGYTVNAIIPNMSSLFFIGDHGIVSLTGSTITNDPNTWYQINVCDTGSIYSGSINFYNNVVYLVNEYGMWGLAGASPVKLDYNLSWTVLSPYNGQSAISTINSMTFYFTLVYGPSFLDNYNRVFILAYCIETRNFYFLDYNVNFRGLVVSKSVNDHNVYAWDDTGNLYQLFNGTAKIESKITTKIFDFGEIDLFKSYNKYMMSVFLNEGTTNFDVTINNYLSQNITSGDVVSSIYNNIFGTDNIPYNAFSNPSSSSNNFTFALNGTQPFYIETQQNLSKLYVGEQVMSAGGLAMQLEIKETSSAVFDLQNITITGKIGRSIL